MTEDLASRLHEAETKTRDAEQSLALLSRIVQEKQAELKARIMDYVVASKAVSFKPEALEAFLKQRYVLLPKGGAEWYLILHVCESVQAPNSTLKEYEENVEKDVGVPLEVGKLSNSVTKPLTIQEVKESLKHSWSKGTQDASITLISKTKPCNLEEARQLCELWLFEGLVAFDPDGLLVWCN